MYDRFDPYPEGGLPVTDPYSGAVTQSSPYPAAPPLPNITPVTTSATPVDGTVGDPTTSTTPTGGTDTTGTAGTDTTGTTDDVSGSGAEDAFTDTLGAVTGTLGGTTGTTPSAPVPGLPSYDVIANAITNVEGVDPGPRKYDFGVSGQERAYQRKERVSIRWIFLANIWGGRRHSAVDYYAPQILQAFDMGDKESSSISIS